MANGFLRKKPKQTQQQADYGDNDFAIQTGSENFIYSYRLEQIKLALTKIRYKCFIVHQITG